MAKSEIAKSLNHIQQLEEKEEYDKAYEELIKLNDSNPDNAEVLKNLAMNAQILKQEEAAIDWWEAYKRLNPTETISYFQLSDLYINRDRYKYYMNRSQIKILENKAGQAIDDYKKAINSTSEKDDLIIARYSLAVALEAMNKDHEAISEYLRLLELDETNKDVYYRLGGLYSKQSDEEAVSLMEHAISLFPEEVGFKEITAKLYYKLGDLDKALEYAQEDLTKSKIYLEKQENDKALEILEKITPVKANAIPYFSLMCEYYYNKKDFDTAEKQLAEFEKLAPNSPLLYQMRALIFEAKGEALDSHLAWSKCYELKGQEELATDELLHAHHADSKNTKVIMSLINTYNKLNDDNMVVEFCEKLYNIDNNNSYALKKLAEFYSSHGEHERAVDFLEKLYVGNKTNTESLKLLAMAYEKIRDFESAKEAWSKYVERAPIGEETEAIKQKLKAWTTSPETMATSSEGFLDKVMSFFNRK